MAAYTVNPSPWEVWPGYSTAPAGFLDESYDFVFRSIVVPANTQQRGIPLRVDFEADFYLRGLQARDNAASPGGNTDFLVRFTDPTGQYIAKASDLAVSYWSQNIAGTATPGCRVPILPEIRIPAGSLILVDIISPGYTGLDVELVLNGVKRIAVGTSGVGSCPVPGAGY